MNIVSADVLVRQFFSSRQFRGYVFILTVAYITVRRNYMLGDYVKTQLQVSLKGICQQYKKRMFTKIGDFPTYKNSLIDTALDEYLSSIVLLWRYEVRGQLLRKRLSSFICTHYLCSLPG